MLALPIQMMLVQIMNNGTCEIAIEVKNVSKVFASPNGGTFKALDNVSLVIPKGKLSIISGENGSGKSLLMTIIAGLEKPTAGNVHTASKVGLVFQDADSQILGETPLEDVCFGLSNIGIKSSCAMEKANDSLKKVRLYEKKDEMSHFLSGGEKRRLAIASILALGFDIVIMDEPYSNLDYAGVKDVNSLVEELLANGKTIVILTHEIEKCLALANHFIVLKKGQLLFEGSPQDGLLELSSNSELWGIRNPLTSYNSLSSLVWR